MGPPGQQNCESTLTSGQI